VSTFGLDIALSSKTTSAKSRGSKLFIRRYAHTLYFCIYTTKISGWLLHWLRVRLIWIVSSYCLSWNSPHICICQWICICISAPFTTWPNNTSNDNNCNYCTHNAYYYLISGNGSGIRTRTIVKNIARHTACTLRAVAWCTTRTAELGGAELYEQ